VTPEELRTAHLHFAAELAAGEIPFRAVAKREVADAATVKRIPGGMARRVVARAIAKDPQVVLRDAVAPVTRARAAVLGDVHAADPPRALVRVVGSVDAPDALALSRELVTAGVPHAAGVTAATPDAVLRELREADVEPVLHLADLPGEPKELGQVVDGLLEDLRQRATVPRVATVEADDLSWRTLPALSRRFEAIALGTAGVRTLGLHVTPHVRGASVLLLSPGPLEGPPGAVADVVDGVRGGQWLPVALHPGPGAERLAGSATPWSELLRAHAAACTAVA
jgi:hypothetical protein